jgi:hypothetical protein
MLHECENGHTKTDSHGNGEQTDTGLMWTQTQTCIMTKTWAFKDAIIRYKLRLDTSDPK